MIYGHSAAAALYHRKAGKPCPPAGDHSAIPPHRGAHAARSQELFPHKGTATSKSHYKVAKLSPTGQEAIADGRSSTGKAHL